VSSTAALVLVNLIPLAGVAFWGWKVLDVVLLYWFENLVIGAFNALAMLIAGADEEGRPLEGWIGKLPLVAFFVVHYGVFCAGHGVVLAAILGPAVNGEDADLVVVLAEMAREPLLLATAGALVASHGYSFWANQLRTGAWRTASAEKLMTRPYGRIVVVHLFIFAAALAVETLGSPLAAMLAFVVLKTALDAQAHRRERARFPGSD
jgi:hypothetical protein